MRRAVLFVVAFSFFCVSPLFAQYTNFMCADLSPDFGGCPSNCSGGQNTDTVFPIGNGPNYVEQNVSTCGQDASGNSCGSHTYYSVGSASADCGDGCDDVCNMFCVNYDFCKCFPDNSLCKKCGGSASVRENEEDWFHDRGTISLAGLGTSKDEGIESLRQKSPAQIARAAAQGAMLTPFRKSILAYIRSAPDPASIQSDKAKGL